MSDFPVTSLEGAFRRYYEVVHDGLDRLEQEIRIVAERALADPRIYKGNGIMVPWATVSPSLISTVPDPPRFRTLQLRLPMSLQISQCRMAKLMVLEEQIREQIKDPE